MTDPYVADAAIERGAAAPDGDLPTLHIRCGSDIRQNLLHAGFSGDFLEFADPYCQGPTPRTDDLPAVRAAFIAAGYGLDRAEAAERLAREQAGLEHAARFQRVVLWFEHDSYDQLILARILAFFGPHARPHRLELICIDRFPTLPRFIGLGQLSPADLRLLWGRRRPVTGRQLMLGQQVWDALRAPSPPALHALAVTGTPALPEMAGALRRHLQELPWTGDGLSLTERLTLAELADGPKTGSELFRALTLVREPLPFLGDLMYWAILRAMADAVHRPFEFVDEAGNQSWAQRRFEINTLGRDLLAQRADWLASNAIERWVGGVRIARGEPDWRWDGARNGPILIGGLPC